MLLFIGYNSKSGEIGDGHKKDIRTLTQPEWSKNLKITNVYNGTRSNQFTGGVLTMN